MATVKEAWAGSTGITITLNSLASATARLSAVVDNTTNLYVDALLTVQAKTSSSALGTNPNVAVYASAEGDGSDYIDSGGAGDSAYTILSPTNLKFLGYLWTPSTSTVYTGLFSLARAFGGLLPPKWSIVVANNTGQSLDASAGGSLSYNGLNFTVA